MTKKIYSKDKPHKDIGKQKFRVRKHYTAWVEYDVVAKSKEEAEDAVSEHGGIERIEWQDGYHGDEPVEVYATDYNSDIGADYDYEKYAREPRVKKVAECIPYEDSDSIDYDDPTWSSDEFEWTQADELTNVPGREYDEDDKEEAKEMEVPF